MKNEQVATILDAVHAENAGHIADALADADSMGETRYAEKFSDLISSLCSHMKAEQAFSRSLGAALDEARMQRVVVESLRRHVDQLRVALDTERACHASTKAELARVRASVSNALAAVVTT